jgi:hypothetical protein
MHGLNRRPIVQMGILELVRIVHAVVIATSHKLCTHRHGALNHVPHHPIRSITLPRHDRDSRHFHGRSPPHRRILALPISLTYTGSYRFQIKIYD